MDDFDKYMDGLRARAEAERQARLKGKPMPQIGKEPPDYHQRTKEREGNSPFTR
jgi:hypothetical protein